MKYLFMFGIFSFLFPQKKIEAQEKSIYDFKVESLDGGVIDFADFKGKKILVVNTASECGYTPQYEGLQKLYELYKDKLVIIGFPSNNFGRQEPGSNQQIGEFCKKNYGVSFPMAAKVEVKGDRMHPLYVWLTQERYSHLRDNSVKWNFQKYLLDENGKLIEIFSPKTEPMDESIVSKIK